MTNSQEKTKGNLYNTGLGNDSMDIATKTQTKNKQKNNKPKQKKQNKNKNK